MFLGHGECVLPEARRPSGNHFPHRAVACVHLYLSSRHHCASASLVRRPRSCGSEAPESKGARCPRMHHGEERRATLFRRSPSRMSTLWAGRDQEDVRFRGRYRNHPPESTVNPWEPAAREGRTVGRHVISRIASRLSFRLSLGCHCHLAHCPDPLADSYSSPELETGCRGCRAATLAASRETQPLQRIAMRFGAYVPCSFQSVHQPEPHVGMADEGRRHGQQAQAAEAAGPPPSVPIGQAARHLRRSVLPG